MYKRRLTSRALVVVFAALAAMAGAEAWAATCTASKTLTDQNCCSWRTLSSGARYCTLWCTGSTICNNTITGLGGNIVDGCDPSAGLPCPETQCSAFGTVSTRDSQGSCDTSLDNLNETCGIEGLAVCSNPADNFNAQGHPFTLGGFENGISSVEACDKKGKCKNSVTLEPSEEQKENICVNPNWTFVTFTASTFKAKSCFCPGGFDSAGVCCATTSRVGDTCGSNNVYASGLTTAGTPSCTLALCTVDLTNYSPNNNSLAYDCHLSSAKTCGGVSGTPCP
jgi:hypothetical protein